MKKLILAVMILLAVTVTQAQNPIDYISITNFNLGTVHEKPLHITADSLHIRFNDSCGIRDVQVQDTILKLTQQEGHRIVGMVHTKV